MTPKTPADGISAPHTLRQALADMGAQLDNFAGEVRELKTLVRQLGAHPPRNSDSTLDIDVEGFKRARRQRMAMLCAAAMMPVVLLAVWGLWSPAPRKTAAPAPAAHVFTPTPPSRANASAAAAAADSPAPAPPAPAPPAPAPPASVAKVTEPAAVRPSRQPPKSPTDRAPAPSVNKPETARVRPMLAVPAPASPEMPRHAPPAPVMAHETSGGAPILD